MGSMPGPSLFRRILEEGFNQGNLTVVDEVFTAGYLITNGGPQNSTLFYVLYLWRSAFQFFEMGYAAALAWVLFFIIMVLTIFVFRGLGSRVHYEEAG